jgi:hypothetical protein
MLFDEDKTLFSLRRTEKLLLCSTKEARTHPLIEIKRIAGSMSGAKVLFFTPVAHDGTRLPTSCS